MARLARRGQTAPVRARPSTQSRQHTFALVPLSAAIDLDAVVAALRRRLARSTEVRLLSIAEAQRSSLLADPRSLDPHSREWMRLTLWLELQRRECVHVLLLGAPEPSAEAWNQRIVREADEVVLLVDARDDPEPRASERALGAVEHGEPWQARVSLLLVHPREQAMPKDTAAWLDARDVDAHIHVRAGHAGDHARLARALCQGAVGLALSGGGARGFAHLGVHAACVEAGLPIDELAGASSGALCAVLLAQGGDPADVARRIEAAFGPSGRPFADFTLPLLSLARGGRLQRALQRLFGEVRLEDLWSPVAVVAASLTAGRPRVIRRGPIWRSLLASMSPPGLLPPVPLDGELLCDGGPAARDHELRPDYDGSSCPLPTRPIGGLRLGFSRARTGVGASSPESDPSLAPLTQPRPDASLALKCFELGRNRGSGRFAGAYEETWRTHR